MAQVRDIILKRQSQLNTKADQQIFRRAVLTTEGGELTADSDPTTEVWADEAERRVWYMSDGATQPAQVLCRKVSNPYVGLGVIIGRADNSNEMEVLSTDFFLTHGTDVDGWDATGPGDLEPGGNKMLWVYTKVITPLATLPAGGLRVTVLAGDYPYSGARKSFLGNVGFNLAASVPGAGLCRYVGLYLDSSNTLQSVDGATATAGTTPPEPTWPAGAFELSVVLLTDGDTTIDFATMIFDRRLAWSDENSSGADMTPVWFYAR